MAPALLLREAHGRNRFADNGFYLFKRPRDGAYWRVMNIPLGVCVAERRQEVDGEGTRADAPPGSRALTGASSTSCDWSISI